MSRVLATVVADTDVAALLELLPDGELAQRVKYGRRMCVPTEDSAREDAAAILDAVRDHQLDELGQLELITTAILSATGQLGRWEAESRMRDVFLGNRQRREEAPASAPHSHPVMPRERGDVIGHLFHEHGLRASATTPSLGFKTTAQLREIHATAHDDDPPCASPDTTTGMPCGWPRGHGGDHQ